MRRKSKGLKILLGTVLMANPLTTGFMPVMANEIDYTDYISTEYEIPHNEADLNFGGSITDGDGTEGGETCSPIDVTTLPNVENSLFEDSYLASAVRMEMNLRFGSTGGGLFCSSITDIEWYEWFIDNLYRITNLEMTWITGIQSLNGIELLISLERLYISETPWGDHQNITDISPLTNLTNLTELHLSGNNISDISPLSGLIYLTELNLASNNISNISPIGNLTRLTSLSLSNNRVIDLNPLSNLPLLATLDLSRNWETNTIGLSDLTPLSGLLNLNRLNLNRNRIVDVSPLSTLINLLEIDLSVNANIEDVSPLSSLDNLVMLNLSSNRISDVSPLSNLSTTNIIALGQSITLAPTETGVGTGLILRGLDSEIPTFMDSLSLFTFTNDLLTWESAGNNSLQWADTSNANDASFSGTVEQDVTLATDEGDNDDNDNDSDTDDTDGEERQLIYFALFGETPLAFAVMSAMEEFTTELWTTGESVDLDIYEQFVLDNLHRITDIHFPLSWSTSQSNLNGIELLVGLERLSVSNAVHGNHQISDLTPLSGLTSLREINLYGNQISNLRPLADLTNLTTMNLGRNNIVDITPLSNLVNLTTLDVQDNRIVDLVPLSGLVNITTLNANDNAIDSLAPLGGLVNLVQLSLEDNNVVNVTPLAELISLEDLNLSNNQINDLSPLGGLITTNIVALGQVIQLAPTTIGTSTELTLLGFDGSLPTIVNDNLNGYGEFNFVDNTLTWLTYGENVLVWFDNAEDTLHSFSGTVTQTVANVESDGTPPEDDTNDEDDTTDNGTTGDNETQAEVDADSIYAMNNFLANNSATNRVTIPYNVRTEAEILNAIEYVLGGIDGLANDVTVNLVRQNNTTIANGQVDNITVQLVVNPTYDFANQTIYFRHATADNNNGLPQTGAVIFNTTLIGVGSIALGAVSTTIKKKK